MTRMQTAAASLVAAIPAALLATLLVMAFLSHSESLKGPVMGLVGATLACSAGIALMPFGILIFGGKKKRGAADLSASQGSPAVTADDDEELSTGDDIVTADSEFEEPTEEIAETVDFDSGALSDVADTELEDEDLFDEEPPKKKRK